MKRKSSRLRAWEVRFSDTLEETPPPNVLELTTLRDLKARTKAAHEGK